MSSYPTTPSRGDAGSSTSPASTRRDGSAGANASGRRATAAASWPGESAGRAICSLADPVGPNTVGFIAGLPYVAGADAPHPRRGTRHTRLPPAPERGLEGLVDLLGHQMPTRCRVGRVSFVITTMTDGDEET